MVAKIQASNTGLTGVKGCCSYVCQNTLFAIAKVDSRQREICQEGNTVSFRNYCFFLWPFALICLDQY